MKKKEWKQLERYTTAAALIAKLIKQGELELDDLLMLGDASGGSMFVVDRRPPAEPLKVVAYLIIHWEDLIEAFGIGPHVSGREFLNAAGIFGPAPALELVCSDDEKEEA